MTIRPTTVSPLSTSVVLAGAGRTADGAGGSPAALLAAGAKALPLTPEAVRTGSTPGKLLTSDSLAQLLKANDGSVDPGALNTALAPRRVLKQAIPRPEAGYDAEGASLTRSEHLARQADGDRHRATTRHTVIALPDGAPASAGGGNITPDLPVSPQLQFVPGEFGLSRHGEHIDETTPEAMKSQSLLSADEKQALTLKAYPLALALAGERWRIKGATFALAGAALFGLWYLG